MAVLLLIGAQSSAVAIRHVTVIDVVSGQRHAGWTVLVRGSRIVAVGPDAEIGVPHGASVVEGRGRYLIPGLWDMHTHVKNDSLTSRIAVPLLVASGVTGVRDMAARLEVILPWRDSIRAHLLLGPRAVVSGPAIDGVPPATEGDITVRTPDEARRAVDSLANAGVDFIKAYEMLRREQLIALVDEARRHHLVVAGHLPLSIDAGEASDLGMVSFEHLRNLDLACSAKADSLRAERTRTLDSGIAQPGRALRGRILNAQRPVAIATEDRARCDALLLRLARNETWQVPTLFLDEVAVTLTDSVAMRRVLAAVPYIGSEMAAWWRDQQRSFVALPAETRTPLQRQAEWLRQLIPRLDHAGVGILAGSDMPNLLTAPGFSLHEELEALRHAGLSNLEALQTATLNPAKFLHATDSLGTIAVGHLADMVLLDADPLRDIVNTRRINAVLLNGRLLRRGDLDALLEKAGDAHPNAIPADLTVPFAPTPVAAEGKRHLMYELHVANFGSAPLTIVSVDVIEAKTGLVLGTPGLPDRRVIDGGMRAVVFIDVVAPASTPASSRLRHRVTFVPLTPPNGPLQSVVSGGDVSIGRASYVTLGPPLRGDGWLASHGLSNGSSHRRTLLAIDGRARIAQRFAIDFTRIGADGQVFRGDPSKNANWTPYEADVLAVADARVVELVDGVPENDPTSDTKAVPITLETVTGNHLILDLGDGRYALYAHLQPGSFTVKQGMRVHRGQTLAKLGNSGQSDAPHLHLHIMNAPSPLASEGLPLVFSMFELEGHVPSLRVLTDGTGWKPTAAPSMRKAEMPVENAVVAFPR